VVVVRLLALATLVLAAAAGTADAACRVTPSRPLDHGRLRGVGAGPVFAMPTPFSRDARHPGWLGSKTLWAWPTELLAKGVHVRVSGRRLDGPREMRFQLGPDWDTTPIARELHIDTTKPVGDFGRSRWGATVSELLVRAPGCYALRLDSERGTSTIVLRVR
jgi:hypothetical protein